MTRGLRSLSFALSFALVTTTLSPLVLAQAAPAPSAADAAASKRMIDVATKLQKEQAFDVAAEQYEAAYKLVPSVATLQKALECYQQLKQSSRILDTARRLLDRHGKELKKADKDKLTKLVGEAQANVGQVDVKASETGAVVTLDDRELGRTPLGKPVDTEAGAHTIVLKKEGFEPFEKKITVAAQQTLTVDAPMEKEITSGKISVKEATGQAATVVVDGKEVGAAPWQGDLPLGKHDVSLKSPTVRSEISKVEIVKRKVAEVEITAIATAGKVDVSTADGKGIIRIDGKTVGEGRFSDNLPVGEHVIAVDREGYKLFSRKITVKAGETASVAIVLEPKGPAAPVQGPDTGEGVFGEFMLTGLFQVGEMGNQGDSGCSAIGSNCSSTAAKGGGVLGAVGYMWNPIGIDVLFGATGDVASLKADHAATATTGPGTSAYDIWRIGAVGAIRLRGMVQNENVRGTLSVGPTFAERFSGVQSVSTDYFAPGLMADLSVAVRASRSTAFAIGFMFWAERAGDDITVNVRDVTTPFHLARGPQILFQPHLGLEFGP